MVKPIKFETIVALTEALGQAAEDKSWDQLVAIQQQRDGLIKQFFSTPTNLSPAEIEQVQWVLATDNAIKKVVVEEQSLIQQQISGMKRAQNAVSMYHQIGIPYKS